MGASYGDYDLCGDEAYALEIALLNQYRIKMDFSEYNAPGTLLGRQQERMLEMLVYIDGVCREHGIKYWLSSGTLLGAVRYGGFIPWDDDVDIEMMRKDYKKFSKVMKKDTVYFFQTAQNDRYYDAPYGKVRDRKSYIKEVHDFSYKYNGIFIDVFVLEESSRGIASKYSVLRDRLFSLMYKNNGKSMAWRKFVFLLTKKIMYCSIPAARILSGLLSGKEIRHTYGTGYIDKLRKKDEIFPLKEICFEGRMFPAPGNTDCYLRRLYGENYMIPPDPSSIYPHISHIEFYE